jgi:ribonuclease HII
LVSAPIIGVDEVGRGCIAGPVVAAAVILTTSKFNELYIDSKKIPESKRESISDNIRTHHQFSIGWSTVEEIDELNILQASLLAMKRAVEGLKIKSGSIFVDGRDPIPDLNSKFDQYPIIKGDSLVRAISAASIVAKVERDNYMKALDVEYGYGFEKHKGYGTLLHRKRIQELGPCQWHRKSFAGVKEYL